MNFEWDEAKNKKNIHNHGISFELAAGVFLDECRIERFDSKHSGDEDRYFTIGRVSSILFVVYTERNANIRIISARPATKDEINEYYEENDIRRS